MSSRDSQARRKRAKELIEFLAQSGADMEAGAEALWAKYPDIEPELRAEFTAQNKGRVEQSIFGRMRRDEKDFVSEIGSRVGDVVGDFRLIGRIGRGGQGEVWEAEQLSLSRRVALKLLLPDRINEKTLALLAREARAGGRLAHKGIVAVHGYGVDDGKSWIAQELVEGSWTLRDFIDVARDGEDMPPGYYQSTAVFLAELAEALQTAHDAGVIHRDVKPQNVLVTPEDQPKLTDFGLARITDESALSMTGDFAGTWLYMSPEQVTAKRIEVDHRTDIFSLGIVMYEMLALVRPFDGDTTHQIAENIVLRDPPDLRKIKSRVPRDLAVICSKALEKLRGSRFQTMGEFAADLRRHLANEPIHAQPPTLVDRSVKWVRRNPTKSAATACAMLAFTVISGLGINLAKSNALLETKTDDLESANKSLETKTDDLELANESLEKRTDELTTSNSELKTKKAEAQQKTEDVLRLSLSQDYLDLIFEAEDLWPSHPDKIGAMKGWISKATTLAGELPALVRKRDELRATAIPLTEEERQAERASHPELEKLAPLHAQIEAQRSALAVGRGEAEVELVDVDWGNHPSDASSLRDAAWDLVRPDRDSFGEEALGFALAERAVEGSDEAELAVVLQVLAWAHHALGEYEAALDVSHAALESGLEDKAEEALSNHEKLEKAVAAASSAEGLAAAKVEIAELKADSAELEARLNERQVWTFSAEEESETRARWWHNQITGLIGELRSLSAKGTGLLDADGVSEEHGWSVARRLAFAERLRVGYAEAGEFAQRWERDLPAIREAYPGLALPTQLGLVPIGPDPTSELWEFWDVHSGTEPLRDAAGELVFEESSGIVFVLLPAEKFWMGAQSVEPEGQNYDPAAEGTEGPVHEVELSAFFMSKYEMTQGQWMSLAGHNPSQYGPSIRFLDHQHDLTHPVESVSWFDCEALLPRFSLVLPSEAQWEYGARAGSDSVWWTGSTRESLRTQEAANLADQAAARAGATWAAIKDWPELDDGFAVHAPVTSFAANAFGLYNVHGNVWEWCLDGNDPSFYLNSPLLDPLSAVEGAAFRVTRGGGFNHAASSARSAVRSNDTPAIAGNILGLRPARVIVK